VVRAWLDADFKVRLLEDAVSAASELNISATNSTSHTKLKVLESTEHLHNLIVCTLCSCYPISLLGLPPAWYKDRCYRARAVREPRALLSDSFGLDLPATVTVKVHDSTADLRYLVIPVRPQRSHGWSEAELLSLVTRNSMLGVEVLH
jgi:nitrile hydratase subunit alpha